MTKDIFVTLAIPTHCSSLSQISERIERFRLESIAKDRIRSDISDDKYHAIKRRRRDNTCTASSSQIHQSRSRIGILALQCHLDRIVWNEFCPMMAQHPALCRAISILLRRFKYNITPIDGGDEGDMSSEAVDDNISNSEIDANIESECYTNTGDFYEQHICLSANKKKNKIRNALLFILPPYPQMEVAPSLEPERIFSPRLVRLENIFVRLQSINAFFSTLGGGYFLCRYLTTAVRLARWQRAVALSLGDQNLAGRCTVNEAYNYIHAGKIKHAFALLKQVQAAAIERGDDLTVSMCNSARYFGRRVRKANAFEGSKQGVNDELQRIRIVKDDSKISRTFRPLKEL